MERPRNDIQKATVVDFFLNDQGSVVIITPNSDSGRSWAEQCLPDDTLYFGSGFCVDHHHADEMVNVLIEMGLNVHPIGGMH